MKNKRLIPLILLLVALLATQSLPAAAAPMSATPIAGTPESIAYRPGVSMTLYAGIAGDLFLAVRIDGVKVERPDKNPDSYMEVRTGANIVVTLHPALLDTLSDGLHTVEIVAGAGTATIQLRVGGAPAVKPANFVRSEGTLTRKANAYHTTTVEALGSLDKGDTVNVLGFMGKYAVVEYEGGPAGLARVNANYIDVKFAAPVTGKTTGAVEAYGAPKASGKVTLRYNVDGLDVTLTGRYGSWYSIEYKEKTHYVSADKITF